MKINELDQTSVLTNPNTNVSEIPNLIPNQNDPLFFKRYPQHFNNVCAIAAYKSCLEEIGISTPSLSDLCYEVTGKSSWDSDGAYFSEIYKHAKRKGYNVSTGKIDDIRSIAKIINQGNPAIVSVDMMEGQHAIAVHKVTKTHVIYADSAPLGIFFDASNLKKGINRFNNWMSEDEDSLVFYRSRRRR